MAKTIVNKKQTASNTNPQNKINNRPKLDFAFGRENYILMFIGLVVLALGYLLMIGGGSDDPNVFSEAVFNTRRMIIAPLTLLIGFIIEILAIMKRPRD